MVQTSDGMPKVVSLERLRLELVEESIELALRRLDNGAAILPDGVFCVMATANGVPLVLMDVVNTQA